MQTTNLFNIILGKERCRECDEKTTESIMVDIGKYIPLCKKCQNELLIKHGLKELTHDPS